MPNQATVPITMKQHFERAGPFFGYFVAAIAGAACHHFVTPLVIHGTRQAMTGNGLLPSGLVLIHPLGLLLYSLPIGGGRSPEALGSDTFMKTILAFVVLSGFLPFFSSRPHGDLEILPRRL